MNQAASATIEPLSREDAAEVLPLERPNVATPDPDLEPIRPVTPERLYRSEIEFVWNSLAKLGVEDRDLEDLTHELFLTAFRRLDEYDVTRPLRPWLFGIALRIVERQKRWRRRLEPLVPGLLSEEDEPFDPARPADEQLVEAEAPLIVMKALEGLGLDHRAVFVMHDLDGYNMAEISAALRISSNTAYSRLRVAREHFRRSAFAQLGVKE